MEGNESRKLPQPVFKALSRDVNKNYCEVCCKCWDKKSGKKRSKLIKFDKSKFENLAARWALVDHDYNEVYKRVDWTMVDMFCCRSCYSMFYKEDYLKCQKQLEEIVENTVVPSPPELTTPSPPVPVRSSTRKRCTYETQRHDEIKKQCIICLAKKKDSKSKLIPVTIITLQDTDTKIHQAEETLLKFAKIHQKLGTKYKIA